MRNPDANLVSTGVMMLRVTGPLGAYALDSVVLTQAQCMTKPGCSKSSSVSSISKTKPVTPPIYPGRIYIDAG